MLAQLPNPMIFAHRGASVHAPENTLAAFALALEQGADGIELDAKLTADEHVVVIHDQTVDRTTKSTGRVGEMLLADLLELDAGSFFDVAYKGEAIPTLEQIFEAFGQKTFINVELTNYASPFDPLPDKVAALVRRHGMIRRVLFSSFNPLALRRIHKLLPEAPLGLLALSGWQGAWARGWLGGQLVPYHSLHPELSDATGKLVTRLHSEERKVFVYTVNQASDMFRLLDNEVDGIFTDDPPLARRVVHAILESKSHRWGHPA
jgi:glycerophosphoryl diester phosphodiesterase